MKPFLSFFFFLGGGVNFVCVKIVNLFSSLFANITFVLINDQCSSYWVAVIISHNIPMDRKGGTRERLWSDCFRWNIHNFMQNMQIIVLLYFVVLDGFLPTNQHFSHSCRSKLLPTILFNGNLVDGCSRLKSCYSWRLPQLDQSQLLWSSCQIVARLKRVGICEPG